MNVAGLTRHPLFLQALAYIREIKTPKVLSEAKKKFLETRKTSEQTIIKKGQRCWGGGESCLCLFGEITIPIFAVILNRVLKIGHCTIKEIM